MEGLRLSCTSCGPINNIQKRDRFGGHSTKVIMNKLHEHLSDFFVVACLKDLLEFTESRSGKTPEEVAQLLCNMNVYEGFSGDALHTMKVKTLSGEGKASFTTVLCFADALSVDERKRALTAALRGFLETKSPDFVALLDRAGFSGLHLFVERLVRTYTSC